MVELEIQLIVANGVLESENVLACIRFSNPFASNFDIDISTVLPPNITIEYTGEQILYTRDTVSGL